MRVTPLVMTNRLVLGGVLAQRFDAEVLISGMSRTNGAWLGMDFSSSSFDQFK
jgi:hypothetical protein